ncbi:MAG: molybdenum ABC transporter molybdate-binding protein, partial [Lentimonas sp.]
MQENLLKSIKFDEKGLVPAIAQDYKTGEVLMFAWMNEESLNQTIKTKFAHYFSRSRQKLWKKGETSGNVQDVQEILVDCDEDCLILKIKQEGVACHTGAKTCFFRKILMLALVLTVTFSHQSFAAKKAVDSITIFSENSLAFPLVKISRLYSKNNNAVVSVNFDYSEQLIDNISNGEPADIFIASHSDWIKDLQRKGLVDFYSFANLAKDKLLIITSKNNKKLNIEEVKQIKTVEKMLWRIHRDRVPMIVDSKATSLGKYTDDILRKVNIKNHRIYRRVSEDKKPITDFINESDEYCGIVLASSINNYKNVVVLKEIEGVEINYQALVIAGDNM